MIELTHYIVRTTRYPGYRGKGATIEEAIKNAEWIQEGDKVHLIRCDAKAYIDDMGSLMFDARERLGTGTVKRGRKGLKDIDPNGGMA